jgi:hypothetical protein
MKCKRSNFRCLVIGLIGIAVISASGGVYAGNGAQETFHYVPASYHGDEISEAKPAASVSDYGLFEDKYMAGEEISVDDWLDHGSNAPGTGIGMGVAPLFDTYGVFRTSGNHGKSTYLALGYIADELAMDEADTSDSREVSGFSYGFGVNNSTSNFEYMMSMDEENLEVSAIGMRFISEF